MGMVLAEREHEETGALKDAALESNTGAENSAQAAANGKDTLQQGHDLRGAFALNYALTSVIRGILSMANDQLDECADRLWNADALAAEADEWIGKAVVRGICTLQGK